MLAEQPSNRPAFWPVEWTIIPEPGLIEDGEFIRKPNNNYQRWLRKNCCSHYDYITDNNGRRFFAFESLDEALLFKLTF